MTYQAIACPGCRSEDLTSVPALMAPFISRYVLDRGTDVCTLCECRSCGLGFYATRYHDSDIARLYDGYREERYFTARHRFEPWYTRRFNEDIGGPAGMAPRKRVYQATLSAHADTTTIGSVLDYAGDRGQLMEGGPGHEHFVYEISGVQPLQGMQGISDLSDLAGRSFDLVLLCGVVEHFSEPLEQLKAVIPYVRPDGLLFVSVPDERFNVTKIPRGAWYEHYLRSLTRMGPLLLLADFWSTVGRVKFGAILPLGFAKQHEHLNYFDVRSLSQLVKSAGLSVVDCSAAPSGEIVALCRRPPDSNPGAT